MAARKTEFWWASIHGADPEPVEKTEHEGRPCVYTLGCGDPFYLDETPCAVMFLPRTDYSNAHLPMVRPPHPDKSLAEVAAIAAERAATPRYRGAATPPLTGPHRIGVVNIHKNGHSWRGPR